MATPIEKRIRRGELTEFLRSRRARIAPEQVGLPMGGRRRTPGLRREEVAQLAGVGVTWYTWLEQGRDINPSAEVLAAISRALWLDLHEQTHLFTLAGVPKPPRIQDCHAVTPAMTRMLTQLMPYPVAVRNARCDLLAYNRAYDWLMGDVDALAFEERNVLLQVFTNPEWQRRMPDWMQTGPQIVAGFRAAMADHIAEPAWKTLLKRLRRESEFFDRAWNQHEVTNERVTSKHFWHPDVGTMFFDIVYLYVGPRSEISLATYAPADEETAGKLLTVFAPSAS